MGALIVKTKCRSTSKKTTFPNHWDSSVSHQRSSERSSRHFRLLCSYRSIAMPRCLLCRHSALRLSINFICILARCRRVSFRARHAQYFITQLPIVWRRLAYCFSFKGAPLRSIWVCDCSCSIAMQGCLICRRSCCMLALYFMGILPRSR